MDTIIKIKGSYFNRTILPIVPRSNEKQITMIYLDRQSSVPLYKQLYLALKNDFLQESDESDTALPAIRTLAKDLCVSINTVNQAYQQLLAEGYIYSVPGSGYFRNMTGQLSSDPCTPSLRVFRPVQNVRYDFRYGSLSNNRFPWQKWRHCLKEAIACEEESGYLSYGDKQGLIQLREAISSMLFLSRGVRCDPEQVIICAGVHDALNLLLTLLPAKDYPVGFEEPGYSTGRNLFLQNGYNITPLRVTSNGINMKQVLDSKCRLLYLTPSHQFPTGHIMPISTRYSILQYAHDVNGYIIEDDYDSEFRYKSMPIPSLQSLDTYDRVIYIGTFSKAFTPTIRVAYLVLPKRMLSIYNTVCRDYKTPVAQLIQHALYLFISNGYYSSHVHKVVKTCEKKYNCILSLFNQYHPPHIHPVITSSGVHLMLEFETPLSEAELLSYVEQRGIRLYPTNHYWYTHEAHPTTLQLGFASMELHDLEEGIRLLFSIIP